MSIGEAKAETRQELLAAIKELRFMQDNGGTGPHEAIFSLLYSCLNGCVCEMEEYAQFTTKEADEYHQLRELRDVFSPKH